MQLDLFKDVEEKIDWKDPVQVSEYKREYRLNNKERISETGREYYQNNKEKKREYYLNNKEKLREYRLNNKERISETGREYHLNNKEKKREYNLKNKERIRETKREWVQNNRAAVNQRNAKRRAMKIRAIPEWLKNCPIEKKRMSHPFKLAQIYQKKDGIKRHVDHMWPLSDGGPHWSGNLEVLTATENKSKWTYSCPKLKKQIKLNLKEASNQNNRENL